MGRSHKGTAARPRQFKGANGDTNVSFAVRLATTAHKGVYELRETNPWLAACGLHVGSRVAIEGRNSLPRANRLVKGRGFAKTR